MPRIEVLPHLTAPKAAWRRGGWTVVLDEGEPQPLPEVLHGWDYGTTLRVHTETTVDLDQIHAHCRTFGPAVFELICLWDCQAAAVRRVGRRHSISGHGSVTVQSSFSIPPRTIADRIRLERQLVIKHSGRGDEEEDPFVPKVPGAIVLWEDSTEMASMAVEGTGGRFPVEAIDFAGTGFPDAAWWLSLTYDDPNDSFLGSARLYLNSAHPAIGSLLEDPSTPSARQSLSVIQWDASRQLLFNVAEDERLLSEHFEEGSVGDVVRRISESILQRRDLRALFALIKRDSDRFETLLQAKLRLLRDE